jgi:glutathione synthase/RimK-type ligase-like ATP-grasp enzyme
MAKAASEYFSARPYRLKGQKQYNYDLAILHNPEDSSAPSNAKALKKFIKVGNELGMYVELITKDDANRLLEFDALFIRETTNVNHHTYRMARKAEAEGLIVIDDPESILRCSNKVYLEEMLKRHNIPRPKTAILHKDNVDEVFESVGKNGPSILKSPDSAFSKGVYKVTNKLDFYVKAAELLKRSDLVIAQEYVPTDFDWRIGVLNNRFLFACKYYMAQGHWQIVKNDSKGECDFGDFEAVPIEQVPEKILKASLSAANIIGKGLYGVDIKQSGKKVYLIEVNDNPNIDAGVEDKILGEELYYKVMGHFLYLLNKQRKIHE